MDPNIKREVDDYNEEDKEAVKQPNLLQAAMDMNKVDSDEELEDDDEPTPNQK